MTEICGAVPSRAIYGRGVHVEPCILAPEHGGSHEPGNMAELAKRTRARRSNPNPPVYPGIETHELKGPAIDVPDAPRAPIGPKRAARRAEAAERDRKAREHAQARRDAQTPAERAADDAERERLREIMSDAADERVALAREAVLKWREAYPELMRLLNGRVMTSDDVRPAPRATEEKTHDAR